MYQCPECGGFSTRPSHKKGMIDALYREFSFKPYRCRTCEHRFRIRESSPADTQRRRMHGLFLALILLGSLLLAFENRFSRSYLPSDETISSEQAQERETAKDQEARQRQQLAHQAGAEATEAIKLHRTSEEGPSVVGHVTGHHDPLFQIAYKALKRAGLTDTRIMQSLKDWHVRGKSVLEIGREWQEEGANVGQAVQEAEQQGFPVRELINKKDALR